MELTTDRAAREFQAVQLDVELRRVCDHARGEIRFNRNRSFEDLPGETRVELQGHRTVDARRSMVEVRRDDLTQIRRSLNVEPDRCATDLESRGAARLRIERVGLRPRALQLRAEGWRLRNRRAAAREQKQKNPNPTWNLERQRRADPPVSRGSTPRLVARQRARYVAFGFRRCSV